MKKYKYLLISIILSGFLNEYPTYAQPIIDIETGVVFTGYNYVRITGRNGTLFSLKDDLKTGPTYYNRFSLTYELKKRHMFSLLYAPLKIKSLGIINRDILFKSTLFKANSNLEGTYKFNSYRFTYCYRFFNKPNFKISIGLTGKIRDANIKLESSNHSDERTSVGFVPLIHFNSCYSKNNISFLLIGDGLIASQGRAVDAQISFAYKWSDRFSSRIGYRVLEGGANGSSVYGFALFNYISLGTSIRF